MKIIRLGSFLLFILISPLYVFGFQKVTSADTSEVIRLNKEAYKARLSEATKTVALGRKALALAKKIKNYDNGVGESYRIIGIGLGYQDNQREAIDNYLEALTWFDKANNKNGVAKVYNNIGNLYRDNDHNVALQNYKQGLSIALHLQDTALLASINLNIGNVYVRKNQYPDALAQFAIARKMFSIVKDSASLISCLQNTGVVYNTIGKPDKAKEMLLMANKGAKQLEMSATIASIDMTLADIYIAQNQFDNAEKYINEGLSYSQNKRTDYDYKYTRYQLEYKRKNYGKALEYLSDIYKLDSIDYHEYVSNQLKLLKASHANEKTLKDQQVVIAKNRNNQLILTGAVISSVLLTGLIILLILNVKRKAQTNKRLTELNEEVSRQKDNLDRINHHLEEIIDERTKDLQIKNRKLSDYSSYLSHQIRGPIATLKGLMNLEKEGLVDEKECISMMNKCVSEIDDKIIDMSDMLHDPDRAGF
ncbi:tetratricopeptide repeat protein [Mucilaginibacter mali]|uniref:Tetratricopeptide repeat protein n=1 Tax=Mucilaginibacter mali TaxID=2740462 RepID=A0A7D4UAN2_9SPHI|nr:tetratricopeptide repeat protein [Mucilaginibacter mali]QKJ30118.1 tetratricopeptide repeat protein [Mucilaginibacter mali]